MYRSRKRQEEIGVSQQDNAQTTDCNNVGDFQGHGRGRGILHPRVNRPGNRANPDRHHGGGPILGGRGRGRRLGLGRGGAGGSPAVNSSDNNRPLAPHTNLATGPVMAASSGKAASRAPHENTPVTAAVSNSAVAVSMGESAKQNRRARRAQRAMITFQDQCQKQQAEAAARQELAKAGKALSALAPSSLTPLPSSNCAATMATDNRSQDLKACHNNSSGPTNFSNSSPLAITIKLPSTNSFIANSQKHKTSIPDTTPKEQEFAASVTVETKSSDYCISERVATRATPLSAMKRSSPMDNDTEDGSESDEPGNDFIMTRTAGKRRGNLSAADIQANEILDDINEDLNASAQDDEYDPVKRLHRGYMNEAIAMAQLALRTNETPVGCVLVHNGRVIARGMNATNMTRNGTRHAELMCINALLSHWDDIGDDAAPQGDQSGSGSDYDSAEDYDDNKETHSETDWQKVDSSKGHLYPYGQKLHPARVVSQDIISECSLYVTVEPCIMCASMLRQYGIKKVYFGAANDKFGGTGGVLRIHMNSKPKKLESMAYIEMYVTSMFFKPRRSSRVTRGLAETGTDQNTPTAESENPLDSSASASAQPPGNSAAANSATSTGTSNLSNPQIVRRVSTIPIAEGSVPARDEGHGGNVETGFDVEGGWGRDKAVFLLRQFYVQENGRAPAPRKKEGRAQRLVEQMKTENSNIVKLPSSLSSLSGEVETKPNPFSSEAPAVKIEVQDVDINATSAANASDE